MGVRRKSLNRPPVTDRYVDAQYIAERFSISYRTALRWIDRLTREDAPLARRFKSETRPKRLRRVQLSLLEARLDELLN
jgi:transposase